MLISTPLGHPSIVKVLQHMSHLFVTYVLNNLNLTNPLVRLDDCNSLYQSASQTVTTITTNINDLHQFTLFWVTVVFQYDPHWGLCTSLISNISLCLSLMIRRTNETKWKPKDDKFICNIYSKIDR